MDFFSGLRRRLQKRPFDFPANRALQTGFLYKTCTSCGPAMSWRVANECAECRFGSAARKQIIMFLADKASDDGSGIWCSKGTIQRHTELGESTVKRTISDFLKEGILVETGRRPCKNGFTVIYRILLARVMALESTAEPDDGTGVTVDPVQPEPGTGFHRGRGAGSPKPS
jgi:hypothetical protein